MIGKVIILQRKSLGVVFILPYNDHMNFFFKNNLVLKLEVLYKFILSSSRFNCMNNPTIYRDFISSCISSTSIYHEYQPRLRNNLSYIRFNRTAAQSSYFHQSIKNWNDLLTNLRIISSSTIFRIKLKN